VSISLLWRLGGGFSRGRGILWCGKKKNYQRGCVVVLEKGEEGGVRGGGV